MKNNIDEDIEIVKEFKEKGYVTLMIKYNKDRIQTNTMVERALENVLSELETYKKIAEKLADTLTFLPINENLDSFDKKEDVLDWARNEVERSKNNANRLYTNI